MNQRAQSRVIAAFHYGRAINMRLNVPASKDPNAGQYLCTITNDEGKVIATSWQDSAKTAQAWFDVQQGQDVIAETPRTPVPPPPGHPDEPGDSSTGDNEETPAPVPEGTPPHPGMTEPDAPDSGVGEGDRSEDVTPAHRRKSGGRTR
jgi:hypothetical protein